MDTSSTQPILLVEDEETDVLFMKMALEKVGAARGLHVTEDGEQAIEYLGGRGEFADRDRHPLPALVFLDLKLPRVMGMDVLKWIRERPQFDMTVVIVLTSSQHRSDIENACALGANSYLVKPANPLHLKSMMQAVQSYWLQLNHPTVSGAISRVAKAGNAGAITRVATQ